jgi:hypothetical protein
MNRFITSTGLSLACLLTLGGIAAAGGNGQAPAPRAEARATTGGTCANMTKVSFKADNDISSSTSSGTFVDIPGGRVNFTQGGEGNGCAIVTFSAESYAEFGRLMFVRAQLDGVSVAAPGGVQFSGDDDEDEDGRWSRSHSFTFIFPSVSPGDHVVAMQFRSLTFDRRVFIGKHTTVVQHQ